MVKDIVREIKRRWFQFVAIVLITTLGVGFFVGIRVTGYNMRETGDFYMESHQVSDLEIRYTLGIDETMIAELAQLVEGEVIGVVDGDAFLSGTLQENLVVKVYEYTQTAYDITLVEGRLPQAENEVLADYDMKQAAGLSLDDTIAITDSSVFADSDLRVVGFGRSSRFLTFSRGNASIGAGTAYGYLYGYELAKKDTITYTVARIVLAEGSDVIASKSLLQSQQAGLIDNRFARLIAPEITALQQAQAELDQAQEDADRQFSQADAQLAEAKIQLDQSEVQLQNGLDQLTQTSLSGSLASRLEQTRLYIDGLVQSTQELFAAQQQEIAMIPDPELREQASAQLNQSISAFAANVALLESSYQALAAGVSAYQQGLLDYENRIQDLESSQAQTVGELHDAQSTIDEGYRTINDLDHGQLYYFERKDVVSGYSEYYQDSDRIEAIGSVFPVIFFGVAVLVALSTISRMIDESRVQIGIYKSLGYRWYTTSMKFIGFTLLSWLAGSLLGFGAGFYFIPTIIYDAYRIMYQTPDLIVGFVFSYAWIPLFISFISSVGVGAIKSMWVSREITAQLLRPPAPKKGQRIILERITFVWKRLSFLYKVSFRNLFRNRTRFLMTLIGIGGCCGLLITGFGLDYTIKAIDDLQFERIIHYDGAIVFEGDELPDHDLIDERLAAHVDTVKTSGIDVTLYAADDIHRLGDFIGFQDRISQSPLAYDESTVIVTEKLATLLQVGVNDTVEIIMNDTVHTITVGVIAENYANHYIYMSKSLYRETISDQADDNLLLFKTAGDHEAIAEAVLAQEGVLSISFIQDMKDTFTSMMDSFTMVVYVVVASALLLELIVISNLISMNISERYKELATLKVLGFFPQELATYILRENIILTAISLAVGCIFGRYLHQYVIISAEIDMVMFSRELPINSFIYAVVITFVFSLIVNLFMSYKANRVNMSAALKTD